MSLQRRANIPVREKVNSPESARKAFRPGFRPLLNLENGFFSGFFHPFSALGIMSPCH